MKKLIGIGLMALALATTAGCAVRGYGHYGPPRHPHREMMTPHRGGYVWIPGHHRWTGHGYRWIEGRWVRPPRAGAVWAPGYRAPRGRGYVWVEGYWR